MAKVLITGSKGVIGTGLQKFLTDHQVFGVDLIHAPGEAGFEQPMGNGTTYARCDVADYRQLERIFQVYGPFDFVYHCAAEFGRWNGEDYYEQVWRTNAIGTKNVIKLQEKYEFKLIHFSSSEVYGDYPDLMTESLVVAEQLNDYAISKRVNEQQIANSLREHNTETVIVRLFNTYGPGEYYHPYRSVNAKFCYHALMGLPVTVYRGYYRTSTYLDDTCRTLANIIGNFKSGETYNIGGTTQHSIEELVQIIWEKTGANPNLITYKEVEPSTTRTKKVDTRKAQSDLGHTQTVDLITGVHKTIDWMKEIYGKD